MPHSCAAELTLHAPALTAVPSLLAPPALYRQTPLRISDPLRPRVAFCAAAVVHAVLTAWPPVTCRHLPATPDVIGLAGIVHCWFAVPAHGSTVSCVLLTVLEPGSVRHWFEPVLAMSPATPTSCHMMPAELPVQPAIATRWWPAELTLPVTYRHRPWIEIRPGAPGPPLIASAQFCDALTWQL